MVMIEDSNGNNAFFLSKETFRLTNRIKEKINKDDSMVLGIFWGSSGSGKSVTAMKIAYAVDPTMTSIDRICFDKKEFRNAVLNNSKAAIIGDEGISLFFSRAAMTKEGREITAFMDQIRQKNLCVFICVPKLLTVDWSILEQANFVAYVWEDKKIINGKKVTIKGNTAFYPKLPGKKDFKSKIIHYLKIQRRSPTKLLKKPKPMFKEPGNPYGEGFKPAFYPVDENQYRKKKDAVLYPEDDKEEEEKQPKIDKSTLVNMMLDNNPELTHEQVAKALNLSRQWVCTLRNRAIKCQPERIY